MELLVGLMLLAAAYIGGNNVGKEQAVAKDTPMSEIEQATNACEKSIKKFKRGSLMFECKENNWETSE